MEISSDRPTPVLSATVTPVSGKPKRKTLSKSSKPMQASKQAAEPAPKKVTVTSKPRKTVRKAAATPVAAVESTAIEIISHQLQETPISEFSSDELRAMIATAAYYRAEQRHFEPGMELDDWLAAERQFLHAAH